MSKPQKRCLHLKALHLVMLQYGHLLSDRSRLLGSSISFHIVSLDNEAQRCKLFELTSHYWANAVTVGNDL
jgi:hypothetical protein